MAVTGVGRPNIQEPTDLEIGQVVHLHPNTQQASRNVHRMLAVRVMKDPKRHWPMVMVEWEEDGKSYYELVHRQNLRRRPWTGASAATVEKKRGDTVGDGGGGMSKWKPRLMPKRQSTELELPDDMEQGTLF
jgi:hypothetical protein